MIAAWGGVGGVAKPQLLPTLVEGEKGEGGGRGLCPKPRPSHALSVPRAARPGQARGVKLLQAEVVVVVITGSS